MPNPIDTEDHQGQLTTPESRPVYPFEVGHRDVWRIALPATIAFVTQPIAGLVDLTVIGRLGDADLLAGLVLGALAFTFIIAFAFFLRIGTAGLVAQSVGARDPDEGFSHFARAAALGIVMGVLLVMLTWPISEIARLFLAPEAGATEPFRTYFGVRLWSTPMVLLNFALLGWFYGRARAVTGMLLQMVVHGGNMGLSVLFVYGLGWGVWGVALGTVLAETIAAIIGIVLALRFVGLGRAAAYFHPGALFEAKALKRMFALSRDLMIRSMMLEASFAIFIARLSREGTEALAGNAILLNIVMFIAFFLDGQAQAAEQLCGKAIGARYRPAFERAMQLSMGWGFALGLALCIGLIAVGPFVVSQMTTAPQVRDAALDHLAVAALVTVTGVLPFVMDGVMIGATLNVLMRNGMIAAFAIFTILVFILQPVFGITGLWIALHGFFMSRGVIYFVMVRRLKDRLFAA